jgi:hypothetical protein
LRRTPESNPSKSLSCVKITSGRAKSLINPI